MKKLIINAFAVGVAGFLGTTSGAELDIVFGNDDFPVTFLPVVTGSASLDDANILEWLESAIAGYNAANDPSDPDLPPATSSATPYAGGPLAAGDYLVAYYLQGTGADSEGGLNAWFFAEGQAAFAVPPTGSGPSGNGALVFARVYDHGGVPVPDSGATLSLIGMSAVGLALARRGFKSQQA